MKKLMFLYVPVLLISCGRSDTDRLAHKWIVSGAYPVSEELKTMSVEERSDAMIQVGLLYNGRVYDIKEDGTFILDDHGTKQTGTWENMEGRVVFTISGKRHSWWDFGNDKIEIFGDSSMHVYAEKRSEDHYISMHLKPAPGEKVETDY